jgi:hypothetical protein
MPQSVISICFKLLHMRLKRPDTWWDMSQNLYLQSRNAAIRQKEVDFIFCCIPCIHVIFPYLLSSLLANFRRKLERCSLIQVRQIDFSVVWSFPWGKYYVIRTVALFGKPGLRLQILTDLWSWVINHVDIKFNRKHSCYNSWTQTRKQLNLIPANCKKRTWFLEEYWVFTECR